MRKICCITTSLIFSALMASAQSKNPKDTELEVFTAGEDEISNTVNYEKIFQIISDEMKRPKKLLETVAHAILDQIRHEFLAVKNIRVLIRKMHPPLGGDVKNSAIEVNYSR